MNDDSKLWLFLLTAGFLFLFVAVTGIQRGQLKDLYERIKDLEQNQVLTREEVIRNDGNLGNLMDSIPPLGFRLRQLEYEVWGGEPDFQVESEIDSLRVAVGEMSGTVAWLHFEHYDTQTDILTLATELRHALGEICHYDPKYNFCQNLVY